MMLNISCLLKIYILVSFVQVIGNQISFKYAEIRLLSHGMLIHHPFHQFLNGKNNSVQAIALIIQ
jgi:hypothetical protein